MKSAEMKTHEAKIILTLLLKITDQREEQKGNFCISSLGLFHRQTGRQEGYSYLLRLLLVLSVIRKYYNPVSAVLGPNQLKVRLRSIGAYSTLVLI
jgi:hypothetical protein